MKTGRKALVIGGARQCRKIAGILEEEGFGKVLSTQDCLAAAEMARTLLPDVVVIDSTLLCGADPLSVVERLVKERPVPVVMVSSYDQIDLALAADSSGVSAHLFRPVARENLLGSIELGTSRFRQCKALHDEVGSCKEALRVRKLVERAKGILMRRESLSEEQAFMKLQKLSRDSNIKMEKLAESIITASEII